MSSANVIAQACRYCSNAMSGGVQNGDSVLEGTVESVGRSDDYKIGSVIPAIYSESTALQM